MADFPPFMNAYGSIKKILTKITEAKTPPRFTLDFLSTNLGFKGGSYRPFIPFAKRLGLLNGDGVPTDLYKQFRNPSNSKAAMAEAIRKGYSALFDRNEYAYKLDRTQLEGLLMEVTGVDKGNATLRSVTSSFEALRSLADFESEPVTESGKDQDDSDDADQSNGDRQNDEVSQLNLSYTIYLNLPKSDDIKIFNAIFKSLRENLLRK
ncbi:MAG: DUF5343 domain-containing protein [Candidatus Binatus sp.]|uniref:DUF5343 domain-containing protein n=1 Tax=Candidatus Binatus sp. TaxID=2811406 RepID=UPI003BB062D8